MRAIATSTTTLKSKTTKATMAGVRESALRPKTGRPRRHVRGK